MRHLLMLGILLLAIPAEAGRGSSTQAIMDAISSGNADAIVSELERAERLVCAGCIAPVMALLDHPDPRVREVAAWWFARRPSYKAAIAASATVKLSGNDATAARNAAEALGTFRHPSAIPALAGALNRMDFPGTTRAAAVTALGTIGDPGAEAAIVGAFADPDAGTRAAAVDAWDALRGVRAGDPLVTLLGDPDPGVRARAAAVVGAHVVPAARVGLESILANDPNPIARRNAAWALMKLGDPASRPALSTAASGDAVSYVRSVAAIAARGLR